MSYRTFDPSRDATDALRHGWLQPGERMIYTPLSFVAITYKVKRRDSYGTVIRHPYWRAVGLTLISPFLLLMLIRDTLYGLLDGPREPQPVAFGAAWDCLAARFADGEEYRTFLVLTDRRLALVAADTGDSGPQSMLDNLGQAARDLGQTFTGTIHTLPAEPVRLRTVRELRPGQYAHEGVVKRWRDEFERVRFPDGSGIDLPRP